jgi:hypothetical protein
MTIFYYEYKLDKYYFKMIKASGEFALSKHPCWQQSIATESILITHDRNSLEFGKIISLIF